MVWALKTWPEHFAAAEDGSKPFELRKDDRPGGFMVGDFLDLWEFTKGDDGEYTGRRLKFRVTSILRDFPGLEPGYVCMGTARLW